MKLGVLALGFLIVGCGSSTNVSNFAGTYNAAYSGTWQNSTPNTDSGSNTDTATIVVSDEALGELKLSWQIPPNPPSGSIIFVFNGNTGTIKEATGVGGNCFMGTLNGNMQTNCCDTCTVTFAGNNMFTQPNAGHYSGTTGSGVAYTGNYSGTWTGTRQ